MIMSAYSNIYSNIYSSTSFMQMNIWIYLKCKYMVNKYPNILGLKKYVKRISELVYPEQCHNHCFILVLILIVFHFQKSWGHLPISTKMRSSFSFFPKNCGHLSFSKKLRSSSIFKKMRLSSIFKRVDVVFNISSSWVETMLNTKNQLPSVIAMSGNRQKQTKTRDDV